MMKSSPEVNAQVSGPEWLFYFTVEDIHAAAKRVTSHGGTMLSGPMQVPGGGWILQARDSQHGRFALTASM